MIIDFKRYRYERLIQQRPRSVSLFLADETTNPFRKEEPNETPRKPWKAVRDDARDVEPSLQT
ncbi:hypothetical protein ASF99_04910 [Exiguobacterium sp. Leaf187]|uniref:hypothetical protein n=1 Tax=Exiguobacterium sp. Leaf187 TaxID=1736294 RepID=UPI0006FCF879|nr:hypothetical protein [Exiguobacterium sp. Leaf187]KQS19229.1 hypothetical protein ASF99_04910 [Exiguobacterium sp. Leaf187]